MGFAFLSAEGKMTGFSLAWMFLQESMGPRGELSLGAKGNAQKALKNRGIQDLTCS